MYEVTVACPQCRQQNCFLIPSQEGSRFPCTGCQAIIFMVREYFKRFVSIAVSFLIILLGSQAVSAQSVAEPGDEVVLAHYKANSGQSIFDVFAESAKFWFYEMAKVQAKQDAWKENWEKTVHTKESMEGQEDKRQIAALTALNTEILSVIKRMQDSKGNVPLIKVANFTRAQILAFSKAVDSESYDCYVVRLLDGPYQGETGVVDARHVRGVLKKFGK